MRVLLISTYELGRQPFGLASPATWLREAGAEVTQLDLSVQKIDPEAVRAADLVAFYLPMHTATRIAVHVIDRVREINPAAHLCAYGLYAPVNGELLRDRGVETLLGGEFEEGLVRLYRRLASSVAGSREDPGARRGRCSRQGRAHSAEEDRQEVLVSLARQAFRVPDRGDLPPLDLYAGLRTPAGVRTVGYTEASRGCKHLCRHCPIVPVYDGVFRIVQPEVVLDDIRQQVARGAEHITFGDPDFFNGPKHATTVVEALHGEFPELTYDVTIKVEHLLRHADLLPLLRDTGCAFVTSAVESIDDRVLEILDKGHTRADVLAVVERCRDVGLPLQPTFVPFTPWLTLEGYDDLLTTLAHLDLVDNVPSIQLAIRLLIPAGSRLLELDEVGELVGPFDAEALTYRWQHPDPRVDALQRRIERLVADAGGAHAAARNDAHPAAPAGVQRRATDDVRAPATGGGPAAAGSSRPGRRELFWQIREIFHETIGREAAGLPPVPPARPRATIPYLTEPWYC